MSDIIINADNIGRYAKRALKEIKLNIPDAKLSEAYEVIARILGSANYHELNQQFRREPCDTFEDYMEGSARPHSGPSFDVIDKLINQMNELYATNMIHVTPIDENRLDIKLGQHSIPLRFGKFKNLIFREYNEIKDYILGIGSRALPVSINDPMPLSSDRVKSLFLDFIDTIQYLNYLLNEETDTMYSGFKEWDIKYFVYKLKTILRENAPKPTNQNINYYDIQVVDQKFNAYRMGYSASDKLNEKTISFFTSDYEPHQRADKSVIDTPEWKGFKIKGTIPVSAYDFVSFEGEVIRVREYVGMHTENLLPAKAYELIIEVTSREYIDQLDEDFKLYK